jgi:hypothetical protein
MESYVRIGGRGLKNITYPYMGGGGVKYFQNHIYVINEWLLILRHKSPRGALTALLMRVSSSNSILVTLIFY